MLNTVIYTFNMIAVRSLIGFAALLATTSACDGGNLTNLEESGVVPNIIPITPPAAVCVIYGDIEALQGNELTLTQSKNQPNISWPSEGSALYTLIVNDPDVPTSVGEQYEHWIVVNIPGNDLSKANTIFRYNPPGPPKGSGLHRYIFVVYKQSRRIEKEEYAGLDDVSANRIEFSLNFFVEKFNLGNPVAANFFRAQYMN